MRVNLVFAVCLLVAGIAQAVPARPLYEPVERPKPPVIRNLRGTTWIAVDGLDSSLNRVLIFMPDGTLKYGSGGQPAAFSNGASWKVEGNNLYFEINNQYREFKGQVLGDVIVGQSWNKGGMRWETRLQRDTAKP